MSDIDADLVRALARVWHRFEPAGQDLEELANMLAPMDDAGEALAGKVGFDMEPADFLLGMTDMAAKDGDQ